MNREYVLLWSQRQNALRVVPVGQVLSEAMRDYRDDRAGDYRPLVIGSHHLCMQTATSVMPTLRQRGGDPQRGLGLRLIRGGVPA